MPASNAPNGMHSEVTTLFGSPSILIKLLDFLSTNTVRWKIFETKHARRERSGILNSPWRKVTTYAQQNAPQVKHLHLKNRLITKTICPASDDSFERNGVRKTKRIDDRFGDGWHKWAVVESPWVCDRGGWGVCGVWGVCLLFFSSQLALLWQLR